MATEAPFLTYLTVFKSRLGIANIALNLTGFQHQPSPLLVRNLHRVLDEKEQIAVTPANSRIFEYLAEKKIVTGSKKKGSRYFGYALSRRGPTWEVKSGHEVREALPVSKTDLWMSDPSVPSTIGVPTPDNVDEALELVYQLQAVSRRTNSWTAAGQLMSGLREAWRPADVDLDNPFLVRAEGIAFLRQILNQDGLIIRPLLRRIAAAPGGVFTRDWVSEGFLEVVRTAVDDVRNLSFQPPLVREAQEHLALIQKTSVKVQPPRASSHKPTTSRGPGVLEHRVAPRLEWLTDAGVLMKKSVPKNSFQYETTPWVTLLLESLDRDLAISPEDAALDQWNSNPCWANAKRALRVSHATQAFVHAYRTMQRRIGPAPVDSVAFLGALISPEKFTFADAIEHVIGLAQETEGASLSGGRYRREAENIFIPESALERLS